MGIHPQTQVGPVASTAGTVWQPLGQGPALPISMPTVGSQVTAKESKQATEEYGIICAAVTEILEMSYQAFSKTDYDAARKTEPLEQVIDALKEELRTRHILRLQKGDCSVAAGFVWSDLLTNLERVSDHCSNISGCVLDTVERNMNIHENQRAFRDSDEDYIRLFADFEKKYSVLPDIS